MNAEAYISMAAKVRPEDNTQFDLAMAKRQRVNFQSPKRLKLRTALMALGIAVEGEITRDHIGTAHRTFRKARGESRQINDCWNVIKRHICRVCDGVKLNNRAGVCSTACRVIERTREGFSTKSKPALLLIALCLCASVVPSDAAWFSWFAKPKTNAPVVVSPVVTTPSLPTIKTASGMSVVISTNGSTSLAWNPGNPAETTVISNLTTRTGYYVGAVDRVTLEGQPTGTNVYTAVTYLEALPMYSNYVTNTVTAASVIQTNYGTVKLDTYIYRLTFSGTNGVVQKSTNMNVWLDYATLTATNPVLFITNDGRMGFYRVRN